MEAEKDGKSESIRYSETFAKKTFYYAVRLDNGNVLRVGKDGRFCIFYLDFKPCGSWNPDGTGPDPGVCVCREADQGADQTDQ